MRLMCRVADSASGTGFIARRFDGHRGRCLRCQADAVRQRSVTRNLGDLEGETLTAPGGLHTQVMARLPEQDAANPRHELIVRLVARYVTAIGVGVAAFAAIIGRLATRRRRA